MLLSGRGTQPLLELVAAGAILTRVEIPRHLVLVLPTAVIIALLATTYRFLVR